jgi:SAM-dependent methyltransferase
VHESLTTETISTKTFNRSERLRRFVEAYWLRPENALWMTLRSEVLSNCPLEHPSIDLCCGDGVFSFLHCGGAFDPAFDVFTGVADLDRSGAERGDMFDCFSDGYRPAIIRPPFNSIDVGADFKPTMLAKAKRLNLYGKLIEHDNNRPLPFDDEMFQTVYTNAAYWIVEIDRFLREVNRITRRGGRIILHVKLDSMLDYTLGAFRRVLGDRFLEIIDRGRAACWPTLASRVVWESRFARANLSIECATPFVTRTHAHIWDVGLRPIAPLLVKMTAALRSDTRDAIKREWVDLFCGLLEPFCDPSLDLFSGRDEPAEIQYVLSRLYY